MNVNTWLQGKNDYFIGLALYTANPRHNSNIARLLAKGNTPKNYYKLKYELSKLNKASNTKPLPIAKTLKPPVTKPQLIKKSIVAAQANAPVYFHELPPDVRPFLLEANNLFKELCKLKVDLNETPAKAEDRALKIQLQIFEKRQANAIAWQKIDYWRTYKKLPPEPIDTFTELTPVKQLQKKQLLEQNISKLKSRKAENETKLKSAPDQNEKNKLNRKIEKQAASILVKEEELLKIKSLING